MAGPCAVESEDQLLGTAEAVAEAGARIWRGGAYKPRSSPYAFQGLGVEGLKLLRKASQLTGFAIVTEVMSEEDVHLIAEYADSMQVGTRSVENYALLEALGDCRRPVLPETRHDGNPPSLRELRKTPPFGVRPPTLLSA
jgi:3-deoxy-7-phosphoheptulonate synthase